MNIANKTQCQQWKSVKSVLSAGMFPDARNDHNYCRNINLDPKGPWCLIAGSYLVEYCDIPFCSES